MRTSIFYMLAKICAYYFEWSEKYQNTEKLENELEELEDAMRSAAEAQ